MRPWKLQCTTDNGGIILEFNFDTDLINGKTVMDKFMRMCVSEDAE